MNKDDDIIGNDSDVDTDVYERQFKASMAKLDENMKIWKKKWKRANVLHYTLWFKNKLINAPIINVFASTKRKNVLNMIKSWKIDPSLLKENEEVLDGAQKQLKHLKKSLENKIWAYKKIQKEIEQDVKHWAALSKIELDRLTKDYVIQKSAYEKKSFASKWDRIKNEKLHSIEEKRKKVVKKMIKSQAQELEAQEAVSSWMSHTQSELGLLDQKLSDIWLLLDKKTDKKRMLYKWERLAQEARKEEELKDNK